MYRVLLDIAILVSFLLCVVDCRSKSLVDESFDFAEMRMRALVQSLDTTENMPRSITPDGKMSCVDVFDWTSGFFPGSLWYLYEYTQDEYWRQQAELYSKRLEPIQYYTKHHDLGFMAYCSFGNGYRLTANESYKKILLNSAESLSTRFIPMAGVIKSWDFSRSYSGTPWYCPVIIDNMMNLELLFFASKMGGNDKYRKIAISHADKTLKYHIRKDYSSYHVVNYDTLTGKMTDRGTRQGLADNSTWARGQGWAIYGFTMVYRETQDDKYLKVARKLADFYINNSDLPEDFIPYWDFKASDLKCKSQWGYNPQEYKEILRDVSAAAVVASGLLELSQYVKDKDNRYFRIAEQMLAVLQSNYRNNGNRHNFVLDHSVGDYPRGTEIDVPLVYADYYFLEALVRYNRIVKGEPVM